MARITATIYDEEKRILDANTGEGGEFSSQSEFIRSCMHSFERVQRLEAELEAAREEIEDLRRQAERVDDLERDVERLKNEKQTILAQREENQQLQAYVDEQRSWRKVGLLTRAKWWLRGMPEGESV
jgi:Arc/MetJ-type ribon-helix-helix transcriptional regulator